MNECLRGKTKEKVDSGLDQDNSNGDSEKWVDLGDVLKVEVTKQVQDWIRTLSKKEFKNDLQGFALSPLDEQW